LSIATIARFASSLSLAVADDEGGYGECAKLSFRHAWAITRYSHQQLSRHRARLPAEEAGERGEIVRRLFCQHQARIGGQKGADLIGCRRLPQDLADEIAAKTKAAYGQTIARLLE
jgi:hypothetical protein